ncbi:DUF6174 domain-containing protein [Streptomyces sp. NPDC026673]|uniref:DUF6174 domain-containing protein n=1 Tax=Streptomyces sp. NPDC026673 TaxID=3155724 RepID=UPI0033CEFF98
MPRLRALLLVAVSALALPATTGCGSDGDAAAEAVPRWVQPERYSFTLVSEGGERRGIGTFRITVADGKVVEAVGLDESARLAVAGGTRDLWTLEDLLAELRQARADEADVADAVFAPDGHPTEIHIDGETNSVDDEADYRITEYRVHP